MHLFVLACVFDRLGLFCSNVICCVGLQENCFQNTIAHDVSSNAFLTPLALLLLAIIMNVFFKAAYTCITVTRSTGQPNNAFG